MTSACANTGRNRRIDETAVVGHRYDGWSDPAAVGEGSTARSGTVIYADAPLRGPTLEADASVGANATILPDATVGRESFAAAGGVVTGGVPPERLAVGVPARTRPLPEALRGGNEQP